MPAPDDPGSRLAPRQGSEPALCCWYCGYELFASDLPSQNFACPECGRINLPNDAHCSPYARRSWPHPVLVLLMMAWPGLLAGVLIAITIRLGSAIGAIASLLVIPQCLLWPISITDSMLHLRVPGMSRRSSRRLFLWGGIVLNFGVSVLLPWAVLRL